MTYLIVYILWSIVPLILLKIRLKKDGHSRTFALLACLVWGWIVYLDYFEMKKHRPWLFK